jgi:hypothetical protein
MSAFPISPLSLDCLTRDYFGAFDAAAIAQIAPLCEQDCYQPKFYRAPALSNEVIAANGYASYGLKITPGAIIYGFFLPPDLLHAGMFPALFNAQIRDQSLKHNWYDQPVPSYFLGNYKPTYLANFAAVVGSAPCFLDAPYPVVGNGLFLVEIWETSGTQQRIELVFGVLEPIGECL